MNSAVSVITRTNSVKTLMKKMSWALPLFFLAKGLLWLLVPALIASSAF